MSKHTPGPWVIDTDHPNYIFIHAEAGGVAEMNKHLTANAEGNARLIAAAPELLEALKDIVAHTFVPDENCSCHIAPPCSDCVDNAQTRELLKQARAAIAKATGKDNA